MNVLFIVLSARAITDEEYAQIKADYEAGSIGNLKQPNLFPLPAGSCPDFTGETGNSGLCCPSGKYDWRHRGTCITFNCDDDGVGYFIEKIDSSAGEFTNRLYMFDGKIEWYTVWNLRCVECPAGRYNEQVANTDQQFGYAATSQMMLGMSSAEISCTACPIGKYQSQTGQKGECKTCPEGRFGDEDGLAECSLCPRHQYRSTETDECKDCPVGKFTEFDTVALNAFQCNVVFSCPEGKYVRSKSFTETNQIKWDSDKAITTNQDGEPNEWNLECGSCPENTFMPRVSYDIRANDPQNDVLWNSRIAIYLDLYQTNWNINPSSMERPFSQVDLSCDNPSGRNCADECCGVPTLTADKTCFSCLADSYAVEGSRSCSVCPEGKFSVKRYLPIGGANAGPRCQDCPHQSTAVQEGFADGKIKAGYYYKTQMPDGDNYLAKQCIVTQCPAGKFSLAKDGLCTDCPAGKFQDQTGQGQCKDCPQKDIGDFVSNRDTIRKVNTYHLKTGQTSSSDCDITLFCERRVYIQHDDQLVTFDVDDNALELQPVNFLEAKMLCEKTHACGNITINAANNWDEQSKFATYEIGQLDKGKSIQQLTNAKTWEVQPHSGVSKYFDINELSFDSNNQLECKLCPAGKYNYFLTDMSTCKETEKGTYAEKAGWRYFKYCEKGKYQDEEGQSLCKSCPAGYYADQEGLSDCKAASLGYYTVSAELQQVACPHGKYSSPTPSNVCTCCPLGRWSFKSATTYVSECVLVPAGKFKIENLCTLETCPAGKYQDLTGQTDCKDCKFYASERSDDPYKVGVEVTSLAGSTSKADCSCCPTGRYQPTIEATVNQECIPANQNQYVTISCRKQCTRTVSRCPRGKFVKNYFDYDKSSTTDETCYCYGCDKKLIDQSPCEACPVGKFGVFDPDGRCLKCPAGQFQNETEQFGCKACSSNHFCLEGAARQLKCPRGKFQNSEKKSYCEVCIYTENSHFDGNECVGNTIACEPGKFLDRSKSAEDKCETCPEGKFQTSANQLMCTAWTDCKSGEFVSNFPTASSDRQCLNCASGRYSDTTNAVFCKMCNDEKTMGCYRGKKNNCGGIICQDTEVCVNLKCQKCPSNYVALDTFCAKQSTIDETSTVEDFFKGIQELTLNTAKLNQLGINETEIYGLRHLFDLTPKEVSYLVGETSQNAFYDKLNIERTKIGAKTHTVYVKQGGCVHDNGLCKFSRNRKGIIAKACNANGASRAFQANARLYYGRTSLPNTIPIVASGSCASETYSENDATPVLSVNSGQLLQTADTELLFHRFAAWPQTLGISQAQSRVIGITPEQASPAAKRKYNHANWGGSRRRYVPASIGVAGNNDEKASSFQFTQSHSIWSSYEACKRQANEASQRGGTIYTSTKSEEVCNDFGCVSVRNAAGFGILESSHSSYMQHLQACLNADTRIDSELPVNVALYLQPPTEWQYSEYSGLPTYVPESASSAYRQTNFGAYDDQSKAEMHTPSPTPSIHNSTKPNVICTDQEHCCFTEHGGKEVTMDAESLINITNVENVQLCLKKCADYLICRAATYNGTKCKLFTLPMISQTAVVPETKLLYSFQPDSDCAIPGDVKERLFVEPLQSSTGEDKLQTNSYAKLDCCMHRISF